MRFELNWIKFLVDVTGLNKNAIILTVGKALHIHKVYLQLTTTIAFKLSSPHKYFSICRSLKLIIFETCYRNDITKLSYLIYDLFRVSPVSIFFIVVYLAIAF